MKRYASSFIALLVLTTACNDDAVVGLGQKGQSGINRSGSGAVAGTEVGREAPHFSVLTQNLYVGADVDAVIAALVSPDPGDDVPALLSAIETFQATDFQARLGGVAEAIRAQRPDAVGLQEVSVLDVDLSPLGIPTVIHADFLPVLQQALEQRGLHYQVAAKVKNIEAAPVPGVSLIDYDVLLVNSDRVTVFGTGARNFGANLGIVAPGVELKRGWVWANVRVEGRPYFITSTHLEGSARNMPALMAAQASELAAFLPSDMPVFVMGDFNDQPGSLMYQAMTQAGFTDLWAEWRGRAEGLTCCQAADLSNTTAQFSQRIDYVFARAATTDAMAKFIGTIRTIGDTPGERDEGLAYSIWPSDHAGLAVRVTARVNRPEN